MYGGGVCIPHLVPAAIAESRDPVEPNEHRHQAVLDITCETQFVPSDPHERAVAAVREVRLGHQPSLLIRRYRHPVQLLAEGSGGVRAAPTHPPERHPSQQTHRRLYLHPKPQLQVRLQH